MYQLKQLIKSRIQDIKKLQSYTVTTQTQSNSQTANEILNLAVKTSTQQRYNQILKQKNKQQQRNKKQNKILLYTNINQFNIGENIMYRLVLETILTYDKQFDNSNPIEDQNKDRLIKQPTKDKLYRLLRIFFMKNSFKQKISYLKNIFNKQFNNQLVYLVFVILSEWSKKVYWNVLTSQIKQIKSKYLRQKDRSSNYMFIKQTQQPISQMLNLQKNNEKEKEIICQSTCIKCSTEGVNQNSTHSINYKDTIQNNAEVNFKDNRNNKNKIIVQRYATENKQKCIQSHKETQKQKDSKPNHRSSVGNVNSSKLLTIYNRITLYSYFIQQISQYYKLTNLEQIDINYLKILPKKKMKQNLLLVENLNRAAQVLIEQSTNKQQRNSIKQYAQKYRLYKVQLNKQKQKKMQHQMKINKSIRTMSDHLAINQRSDKIHVADLNGDANKGIKFMRGNANSAIKNSLLDNNKDRDKKYSVQIHKCITNPTCNISSSLIYQPQNLTQSKKYYKQLYNFQIQIPKNYSSSLLNRQFQDYQNQLKERIKKQLTNRTSKSNKMKYFNYYNNNLIKFPNLSKSTQKQNQCKYQTQKNKLRIQTQQNLDPQQIEDSDDNQCRQNSSQILKLSQRQTIKGIIVRNFLSNRQKMKNKMQKEQKESQIKDKSAQNIKKANKMMLKYEHQSKKIMQCIDIRSLRQKTKALLYNFKKVQHY